MCSKYSIICLQPSCWARLRALEDAPWEDSYGKPLTARGLAKLLEPYRVLPHLRQLDGDRRRSYFRSDSPTHGNARFLSPKP